MSILSCASGASVWRGYDYFVNNKVLSWAQSGEDQFEGSVSGSGENIYHVNIDVRHPKRSTCNCPYAEGTRIVCKHKVALYFAVCPIEAEGYIQEVERYENELRQHAKEEYRQIVQYVNSLSLEELRLALKRELISKIDYYGDDYDENDFDDDYDDDFDGIDFDDEEDEEHDEDDEDDEEDDEDDSCEK